MKTTKNYYNVPRSEISVYVPDNIKTILDVGCGEGAFLKLVKEQTGAETWGIEVIKDIAGKANEKVDNILTGKIEDLMSSLPNDYFDCIAFNDVLEHLIDPSDILKKMKNKLSSKGVIIASIPNVRYFFNLYELLLKKDWEYKDAGILDSTHLRFFTKKSMARMFEKAGYKLIKQIGINKIISRKFLLFNLITFGLFNDTKYLQFLCIVKTKYF